MEAQLIVVWQNGYEQAHNPHSPIIPSVINIDQVSEIKNKIAFLLKNVVGRNGHVLVKWNGKMYVCEMKQNLKDYSRIEVEYHPHQSKFSI